MSPPSFPPAAPCTDASLPSAGSLGSVPPLRWYYEGTPTSRRTSHVTSFPSIGGTLPHDEARIRRDLPGSCRSPMRTCSALGPRWDLRAGPLRPRRSSTSVLPSAFCNGVGSHIYLISGLYHTACTLAVYASQSRLPVYFLTTTQDSLPAGGQPWPGGRREAHVPLGPSARFLLSS
jgi:hypothetical protein